MKKAILILSAVFFILSWQQPQKERLFTITIPERLGNSYWLLIHNQTNEITIGAYNELIPALENQLKSQAANFHIQDSLAAVKNKK